MTYGRLIIHYRESAEFEMIKCFNLFTKTFYVFFFFTRKPIAFVAMKSDWKMEYFLLSFCWFITKYRQYGLNLPLHYSVLLGI